MDNITAIVSQWENYENVYGRNNEDNARRKEEEQVTGQKEDTEN